MTNKSNLKYLLADQEVMEEMQEAHTRSKYGTEAATEGSPGLESLLEGDDSGIVDGAYSPLEAIILVTGRPVLLVQDGKWEKPQMGIIHERLEQSRMALEAIIPKVGRVEFSGVGAHLGTGWMIEEGILVTNRHVAERFAERNEKLFSFRRDPDGQAYVSRVDFLREYERTATSVAKVSEIIFLEERGGARPDMALLRLDAGSGCLPHPVELDDDNAPFNTDVAVLGYPASDPRNDAIAQRDIFRDIYGVKRLCPGKVRGVDYDGKRLLHDCTTLGGNSGSLVVNLETGKACGLHFAGDYLVNNYAVSVGWLKSRLAEICSKKFFVFATCGTAGEAPSPESAVTAGGKGYDPNFLDESTPVVLPQVAEEARSLIASVSGEKEGEIKYTHFSIAMHRERRLPFFAACNIDGKLLYRFPRRATSWMCDDRLSRDHQLKEELCPPPQCGHGQVVGRLAAAWGGTRDEARQALRDTFFLTNCSLQQSQSTCQSWHELEEYVLGNAATHDMKISLLAGPVLHQSDPQVRGVQIPQEFWKILIIKNHFTSKLVASAFLLSPVAPFVGVGLEYGHYRTYQVPIKEIGERTGLDFGELHRFDPLHLAEGIPHQVISDVEDILL